MVGEYTIVDMVGEGGMGVVYRGVQPVIKKRVAIKVLKPHIAADGQQVERLVAEAEAVNAIRHRSIIDIFGLGQLTDGRPYIVMEFLEGEPLDARLRREPLELQAALELVVDICGPLGAAHSAGVVHRDLKPSNVFLCRDGDGARYLKLLDFGLAKRVQGLTGSSAQTSRAIVSGTPDYMAPEQARGLDVSPRTDIYALGVMIYELVRRQVPFSGASPMDVMVAHVSKVAPPLGSGVPALDRLLAAMLAKDIAVRPQTVFEVKAALERVLVEVLSAPVRAPLLLGEVEVDAQPVPPREVSAPVRPSRVPLLLVFAAVAVAAVGGVFLFGREGPRQEAPVQPVPSPAPPAPVTAAQPELELAPLPQLEPAPPAGLATPAPDAGVRRAGPRPLASTRALLARIARDQARASDPSAQVFLDRIRRKLKADDSPAGRRQALADLELWERQYPER
jgi:serine/threonine-protein kinase